VLVCRNELTVPPGFVENDLLSPKKKKHRTTRGEGKSLKKDPREDFENPLMLASFLHTTSALLRRKRI
jgi:hypothetical protein